MIPLSLTQIASIVNATHLERVDPATMVVGVATDSRLVQPGDLFVALVGERTDGHDHIESALAAGAVAVLGTRRISGVDLLVTDSVVALGSLASGVLEKCRDSGVIEVIAITGSSGKTSTKDLLAQVLSELGETVAPKESFNTEIGLPMTVLTATETTRCLVLEMGARLDTINYSINHI